MIRTKLSLEASDPAQRHVGKSGNELVTVVNIVGDVDARGMKQVTAMLNSAVKRGTGAVIVSFERAEFFESGLLRELMRVGHALAVVGRRISVAMPRGHPGRHIFHVLNLDRVFECFESQAQALKGTASLGPSRGSAFDRLQSWA